MARLTVNPGDVGVEVPDQPQQGGGDNRDAITQALMAQGASAGGAAQMSDPRWLAAYQGQQQAQQPMPADWMSYMGMKPQPSGSQTDVGWMNALQPWQQSGVGNSGYPGNPDLQMAGWRGGGSMAGADPNYWQAIANQQQQQPRAGSGSGYKPAYFPGGGLNPNDPDNISEWYRIMGMGGMGAGAQGAGSGGYGASSSGGGPFGANGPAIGATGISPSEANQAAGRGFSHGPGYAADVANNQAGLRGTPIGPDASVFGAGTTGFDDYGGITGPSSAGFSGGSVAGGPAGHATVGEPGSGTAFGSSGYGGFGLGAQGVLGGQLGGNAFGGDNTTSGYGYGGFQ